MNNYNTSRLRIVADSYTEAEIKLEKLSRTSYAYSTDEEMNAKQKAEKDTKKLKCRDIKYGLKTITEELEKAKTDFKDFLNDEDTVDEKEVSISSSSLQKSDIDSDSSKEKESPVPTPQRTQKNILIEDSSSEIENGSNRGQRVNRAKSKNKKEGKIKFTHLKSNSEISQISRSQSSNKNLFENQKKNSKGLSFHELKSQKFFSAISSNAHENKIEKSILDDRFTVSSECDLNRVTSKIKEKDTLLNRPEKMNKKASADGNDFSTKENENNDLIDEKCLRTLMEKIHRSLSMQISRVKGEVVAVKNLLENLQLQREEQNVDEQSDAEDDGFKFPLTTYDVFKDFDEKLKTDQTYRRKIKKRIRSQINAKQDFSKNLGEIIRFFIARVVALKFTAVKKMNNKELLKDTHFYKLLQGLFLSAHKEAINSKQFGQLMGKVLNNAKDWDGFRFIRQQETIKNNKILVEKKKNENAKESKRKPKNNQDKDENDNSEIESEEDSNEEQ